MWRRSFIAVAGLLAIVGGYTAIAVWQIYCGLRFGVVAYGAGLDKTFNSDTSPFGFWLSFAVWLVTGLMSLVLTAGILFLLQRSHRQTIIVERQRLKEADYAVPSIRGEVSEDGMSSQRAKSEAPRPRGRRHSQASMTNSVGLYAIGRSRHRGRPV